MLRMACGKVNLDPPRLLRVVFPAQLRASDATDVPAAQQAAHQETWLPRAHEDALGACGAEPPPEETAQAVGHPVAEQARSGLTPEGLPRRWRIGRADDLAAVSRHGTRRRTSRLEIAWLPNTLGHPRLGLIVPRYGRSAVARNQLRRRLREHARRTFLPSLPPLDVVIRSRAAAYGAPRSDIRADLDQWHAHLPR